MPSATIDACCLIDLLASGHAETILRTCGYAWHLPVAVQGEVQFVRQPDPDSPGKIIKVVADLGPLLGAGVLALCQTENQQESDLFTQYATQFRSDGEAMCLALAEARSWLIATDDRKAIRIARQAGLSVVSCPELVKTWADVDHPDRGVLTKALEDIELLAHFRPSVTMPEYQWWMDQLSTP
jgi:hypothetical protein